MMNKFSLSRLELYRISYNEWVTYSTAGLLNSYCQMRMVGRKAFYSVNTVYTRMFACSEWLYFRGNGCRAHIRRLHVGSITNYPAISALSLITFTQQLVPSTYSSYLREVPSIPLIILENMHCPHLCKGEMLYSLILVCVIEVGDFGWCPGRAIIMAIVREQGRGHRRKYLLWVLLLKGNTK